MRLPRFVNVIRRAARSVDGQDLIEYALLIALIATGVIVTVTAIATKVPGLYTQTFNALPGGERSSGGGPDDPGSGDAGSGNPGNGNPGNGTPGNGTPAGGNPGNGNPGSGNPGNDQPVGNPGSDPGRGGGPAGSPPPGRGGSGAN